MTNKQEKEKPVHKMSDAELQVNWDNLQGEKTKLGYRLESINIRQYIISQEMWKRLELEIKQND